MSSSVWLRLHPPRIANPMTAKRTGNRTYRGSGPTRGRIYENLIFVNTGHHGRGLQTKRSVCRMGSMDRLLRVTLIAIIALSFGVRAHLASMPLERDEGEYGYVAQ